MPRLRTLLAALLVAAGLAVPAAADVVMVYPLHVRAERNASVDVTFQTAVTVIRGHATTGGGGWAGYYLQPLGRNAYDGFGQVWLPALSPDEHPWFAVPLGERAAAHRFTPLAGSWRLPAGRYRLHAFGAGAVDVLLLVSSRVPARRLVASRPSTVDLTWRQAATAGVPGVAYAQTPVTVGPRALAASVALAVRHGLTEDVTSVDTCLGSVRCVAGEEGVRHTLYDRRRPAEWPAQDTVRTVVGRYYPGTLDPGEATAYATVRTSSVVDRVVVAAFSLAL